MKRQWMDMKYDKETECWFVVHGGNEYMMHCGDCLLLRTGDNDVYPAE